MEEMAISESYVNKVGKLPVYGTIFTIYRAARGLILYDSQVTNRRVLEGGEFSHIEYSLFSIGHIVVLYDS
jgi:hypothetical protein